MAADSQPHNLSGMVCLQRQGQDASLAMAAADSLGCLNR